jgi:hypothetical protein
MRTNKPSHDPHSHPGAPDHDRSDEVAKRNDETAEPFDVDGFAAAHHGIFRLTEVKLANWTRSQLQVRLHDGRLERMHDEVFRFRAAPLTWEARALGAVWSSGDLAGLSHASANHLYDLPGATQARVEILSRRWERAQQKNLRVHEFTDLEESDLTVVRNIPVVVPELALLQIAGHHWSTVDHVETALYRARRQGLVTNASVQEYLYRRARRGRPGVRRLREALAQSSAHSSPTDSDPETNLLQTLRANGFPEPTLQFVLRDPHGKFIARVDAALERWHILLEYDSREHHSDPVDQRRDERRRLWAMRYGYWMVPVRCEDLDSGGHELVAALRGLIAMLEQRSA